MFKKCCLFFFVLLGLKMFSQSNPFTKNREKGAIFKYDKKDFTHLFYSIYHRNHGTYSGDFKTEAKIVLTIDTAGKITGIVFKIFAFDSYYTSDNMFESTVYNKPKIYAAVKSDIRNALYATSGLWLPKLKGNNKVESSVEIELNFKNLDLFRLYDNPDFSIEYESLCNNNIALIDSVDKDVKKRLLERRLDSLKHVKASWRIEVENFSNRQAYNTAINFSKNNNSDIALVYFKELEMRFPEMLTLKKNIAECFFSQGNKKEACNYWESLKRLGDTEAEELLESHCK